MRLLNGEATVPWTYRTGIPELAAPVVCLAPVHLDPCLTRRWTKVCSWVTHKGDREKMSPNTASTELGEEDVQCPSHTGSPLGNQPRLRPRVRPIQAVKFAGVIGRRPLFV